MAYQLEDYQFINHLLQQMMSPLDFDLLDEAGKSVLSRKQLTSFQPSQAIFAEDDWIYIPIQIENVPLLTIEIRAPYPEPVALQHQIKAALLAFKQTHQPLRINLIDDFLRSLLIRHFTDNSESLYSRSQLLTFDGSIRRRLVFLDLKGFKSISQTHKSSKDVQHILNQVHQILNSFSLAYQEYAIYLYDDKFMLFKCDTPLLKAHLTQIQVALHTQLNLSCYFILGDPVQQLDLYADSFTHLLNVHKKLSHQQPREIIHEASYFDFDLLLDKIEPSDKAYFLRHTSPILSDLVMKQADLTHTFLHFFKLSMDTYRTAQQLFVHKNTVYYRIKKLGQLLDVDLFDPYQAAHVFCQILMLQNHPES